MTRFDPDRYREPLAGGLLLIFGIWLWWYTGSFPTLDAGYPGPALFPRLIAVGLLLSGGLLLFKKEHAEQENNSPEPGRPLALAGALITVLLFPFVQPVAGFVPTLSLVVLVAGLLLKTSWKVAIPLAILSTLAIFLVFTRLLHVPL